MSVYNNGCQSGIVPQIPGGNQPSYPRQAGSSTPQSYGSSSSAQYAAPPSAGQPSSNGYQNGNNQRLAVPQIPNGNQPCHPGQAGHAAPVTYGSSSAQYAASPSVGQPSSNGYQNENNQRPAVPQIPNGNQPCQPGQAGHAAPINYASTSVQYASSKSSGQPSNIGYLNVNSQYSVVPQIPTGNHSSYPGQAGSATPVNYAPPSAQYAAPPSVGQPSSNGYKNGNDQRPAVPQIPNGNQPRHPGQAGHAAPITYGSSSAQYTAPPFVGQANNNGYLNGNNQRPAVPQIPNGNQSGSPSGPGGFSAMSSGYPSQAPSSRPDISMMPSAVTVMTTDEQVHSGLFPTGFPTADAPPLVSTDFYSQDQGNCNPRLVRSTLYAAPVSKDLLKTSEIPFAVACTPFARLHKKEHTLPVIDNCPDGPVRCGRCKAYICPFMDFEDGGRRFRCPFCNFGTSVEESYFAHLDHTGRRIDISQRPELYYGGYDFVASKQYCKNGVPPREPAFLFMIDVSYNAIQSGMVNVLSRNLEKILDNLPKGPGHTDSPIRVGLATFDQAVHFYDLSSTKPSMMVLGDVGDMFSPIADGMLLPFSQAVASIRSVLEEIPRLFAHNRVTDTILGPVISAGLSALKSADRAGKLFIFSTSLPKFDAPGKLKERNERNLLGTDKEKSAFQPQSEFYANIGEECVASGVSVDLFLLPNAFIDVATVAQVVSLTGGSIYKYSYFNPAKDSNRFLTDLQRNVGRQIAFDCMVKVRCSTGIRPLVFNGAFFMDKAGDLQFASIDEDKTFFAEFKHDDTLSGQNAVIQIATLFTSLSGQRRLRILNLCLEVATDYTHLYRMADQDTIVAYLMRTALKINRDSGVKEVREQLGQTCARILTTFREKCNNHTPLHQIVLPETLKLLPLFVNSITKNDAVNAGAEMTVDEKVWMAEYVRSAGVSDILKILYPRIYPVSQLEMQDSESTLEMPSLVRASFEFLKSNQAYLIDGGIVLFLWIGLGVPVEWVSEVFGASSVALLETDNHFIPEKDNKKSRALRRAVDSIDIGNRKCKLFIVREKDAMESWMKKYLVEDKAGRNSASYVDYLIFLHHQIRELLS